MLEETRRAMARGAPCSVLVVGLVLTAAAAEAQVRPAAVKNVDEPGRVPYQHVFSAVPGADTGCGLNFCTKDFPAVPAGKRLVVTDFYGTVSLKPAATVHSLRLRALDRTDPTHPALRAVFEVPNDPDAYYDVALTTGLRRYSFGAKVTMYVEATHVPALDFWTGGLLNTEWPTEITLVGYLVDVTY